jgi:hypothetical protein
MMHHLERRFCFFNVLLVVVGLGRNTRAVSRASLGFRRLAMPDPIGAWAMGTMQHLDDHGSPSLALAVLSDCEGRRSTALKHHHYVMG